MIEKYIDKDIYIYIYPQKGQHIISDVRAIC